MRILLVHPEPRVLRAWAEMLELEPGFEVDAVAGGADAAEPALDIEPPEVVLAQLGPALPLARVEAWAAAHPRTDFLAASADTGPELLLHAMRAGVREVLPAPVAPDAVLAALRRQQRKREPAAGRVPGPAGCVSAVVSCKGGAGTTLVAANLAHLLSGQGRQRVLLVDLDLQFGDAALYLSNRTPPRDIGDLARDIGRLDADLLRASVAEVGPGLAVLAAPADPARAADVQPAHVRRVVQVARGLHDHVVLDVGRALGPAALQALELADHVFPVLQTTLPFLRDAQRLRQLFDTVGLPAQKLRWVVNRHRRHGALTLQDVARALGTERLLTLPNQYDIAAAAVDQGLPVAEVGPRSALLQGLRELAALVQPEPAAPEPASWWSGWMRPAAAAR